MDRTPAIVAYINGGSDAVEGWLYRLDMILWYLIDSMQKAIGTHGDVCEVGVYKGKALALLGMLARERERVIGFDTYPHDWLVVTQRTMAAFCPWLSEVVYIQRDTAGLSAAELRQILSAKVRLLHIDAGHEYHEVLHALYMFSPFVADEGVVVMDDYYDHEYPGVAAATLDFCSGRQTKPFVPFLAGANKMYLCMPGLVERYQLGLLSQPELRDTMRLSRIRSDIVLVSGSREPMSSEGIAEAIKRNVGHSLPEATVAELARCAAVHSQLAGEASLGLGR